MNLPQTQQLEGTEIAVIGMAGRFPGAKDLAAFWRNLRGGVESIKFFTDAELKVAGVDSAKIQEPNFVKACGDLEGSDLFDAPFFGFSPMDAAIMDPQHRVFLECAWEALEDAGYDPQSCPGTVGIFAGSGMNAYMIYNLISNPDLIESMGRFAVWTNGNDKDFLTTRVSYLLNLKGPSINIQTGCSTSLVAIHLASQSLLNGECDIALAGGVSILLPQDRGHLYREGGIMSPDGHCRAFDSKAQGTVYGSGAGIVVLKRLANAIDDGDSIQAIIKGSAINNDGSTKVGYTAPSVEGQAQVITEALEVAGVGPETISYIEAHGTGTPVGDPIEVFALTRAFQTRTAKKAFCGIGSVKTNIGHLDSAAGVAGFIKTVLALKHQELPPSLHYQVSNPEIDFRNSPFFVNAKLSKWSSNGSPRRAGVSSLGVGGTNAHVILEEAPYSNPSGKSRSWHLLVQSAKNEEALNQATQDLVRHLEQNPNVNFADAAYTLQLGRRGFNCRRMLVCRDREDAIGALKVLDPQRVFTHQKAEGDRSASFMFPGGGAQYVNMGLGLYREQTTFQEHVEKCLECLKTRLDMDLRSVLYPPEEQSEESARLLEKPSFGLAALFTIEYALAKFWMSLGIQPVAMIGHSMGEYTAACLAGVISLEDALHLVALRGRLFEKLPEGSMLSVPLSEADAQNFITDGLSIAAVNGPHLCVISGATAAIDRGERALSDRGIRSTRLHISVAAHSQLVEPILGEFGQFVRTLEFRAPNIPYISNVTGKWIRTEDVTDANYWVQHLRQTVRFSEGLQELSQQPNRILLEVGPGQTLSTFGRQQLSINANSSTPVLSSLRHPRDLQSDTAFLLNTLGRLWLAGVSINWAGLYSNERRHRVSLPTYPFQHYPYWIAPGKQVPTTTSRSSSLKKKKNLAEWFYQPTWKETFLPELQDMKCAPEERKASWLVFANQSGFGARFVERLRLQKSGIESHIHSLTTVLPGEKFSRVRESVYSLNPTHVTDYEALLKELTLGGRFPDKIVHLWNVSPSDTNQTNNLNPEKCLDLSFYNLLFLAQALAKLGLTQPLHIAVIASDMQQVAGEVVPFPEKAALLGPCKVIPHELPNVTCTSIDITIPEPECRREEKLIDQLLSELSGIVSDSVIAYRGDQRWVQAFVPVKLEEPLGGTSLLKKGGTYLITGGLGGIALALAEHLAKTIQPKLILVGRRGLPARENWDEWIETHGAQDKTSIRIRKIQRLEALGSAVFIGVANVADAMQMRHVVDQAKEHFGEIHGVIHAAGLIDDGIIAFKSRETAERVLEPKVKGTRVLDEILCNEKLDFFVLFSSVSAISGPMGQADYAAANAFIDSFAQQKALKDRTYTVAIDWGVWRDVGIVAEAAQAKMSGVVFGSTGEPVHPMLGTCIVDSDGEKVYSSELTDRHWALTEHRFKRGEAVLPGTACLELSRAALEQHAQDRPFEISNLLFLEPLVLTAGERRELRVALKRRENDFEFVISSFSEQTHAQTHARGTIRWVPSQPARLVRLSEIEARCVRSVRAFGEMEQHAHVDFGPRWKNIKRVALGNQEALITLELPEAFCADLEHYKLHPALLDMATGGAHALIPGHDRLKDFYVPLSYGRVVVNRPLPAKVFSHLKVREQETRSGIAIFDVSIFDADGMEIVRISDFVVRNVPDTARMTSQKDNVSPGLSSIAQGFGSDRSKVSTALTLLLEQGISPAEGIDAFFRILSREISPRIVVASQDLNALIEAANTAEKTAAPSGSIGPAQPTAAQHSRPQLPNRYIAPSTELERTVTEIWQELLGIQQIGVHDDFFELGGHSLMVVSIHNRLQQTLDRSFPVAKMFQYPTINSLANYLREGQENKPSYENLRQRAERQRERQRQLVKGKIAIDR